MKIDFHTHPTLVKEYVEGNSDLLKASREVFDIGNNLQPIETFYLQMDVASIDKAVLHPIDCERTQGLPIFTNQQLADLCSKRDRFIGFASVDPNDPEAVDKLEIAVNELGLQGLKLAPELQYFYPNDQEVAYPLYEKVQELGIPILFHSGFSWEPSAKLKYSNPLHLEEIALDFSDVKVIIAHFGWPWVKETAALAIKHENIYIDTSCLYFDNPTKFFEFTFTHHLPTSIIENSLRNKVIFGSNYPRIEIRKMVKAIHNLGLTDKCLENIFEFNAQHVLGLR